MMENFRNKFVEEARELIEGLESTLLALEQRPADRGLVEEVFRVMHTLKGNSGMFGFHRMDRFTHQMESLYELIRTDRLEVSRPILDLTLAAVDHLRALLSERSADDPQVEQTHTHLLARMAQATQGAHTPHPTPPSAPEEAKAYSTYYILFRPKPEVFRNGTNPLYLLDELHALGPARALCHPDLIPSLHQIDPEQCYAYWEVVLSTGQPMGSIEDVFLFVEDNAHVEIQKLSDLNLFDHPQLLERLFALSPSGGLLGFAALRRLAQELEMRHGPRRADQPAPARSNGKGAGGSIRVASDKLDVLMNLVSELVTTQARLSLYADQQDAPELIPIVENIQKITRQLRDTAFSIVLVPIEHLLTRFQRLVRDLSGELGKEVVFTTEGAETELDKTIIEGLADPLMHILRNSLDHGIEDAPERRRRGKPAQGRITLSAYYSGAQVMIEVRDDGAGIDPPTILEQAMAKGLVAPERKLSRREILDLLFLPGFSTAQRVTELSGRGVGLDVVKRKIEEIRGEVEIDSAPGKGTTIAIKLPLTLSITDGLLVKVNQTHYVIPLAAVDKIYALERGQRVGSFNNVVTLDGKQFNYFHLRRELNEPELEGHAEQAVVVRYEGSLVALVVDHVVGEYQAVVKPLGRHYKRQDIMSGATILGDGTVALVIDTNRIIKLFAQQAWVEP